VKGVHGTQSPDYVMENTDERKAIDNHIKKDRISNIGVDSTAETDDTVIPGSTTEGMIKRELKGKVVA